MLLVNCVCMHVQELLDELTSTASPVLEHGSLRKGLQIVLNSLPDVSVDVPFSPSLVCIFLLCIRAHAGVHAGHKHLVNCSGTLDIVTLPSLRHCR